MEFSSNESSAPIAIEKIKILGMVFELWGRFLSYLLKSTANPAHLSQKWA
jgi:hypothetical protein